MTNKSQIRNPENSKCAFLPVWNFEFQKLELFCVLFFVPQVRDCDLKNALH